MVMHLYAIPISISDRSKNILDIYGFFIFIFSLFLFTYSRSINLYFDITIMLNIITITYITPKYTTVFTIASIDIEKTYLVISTSNNFAVNTDKTCDKISPSIKPIPRDIKPINKVSKNNIIDIDLFLIPRVI
ncbi:hypothetical protein CNEONATNEC26_01073 [Clostridium neonatale]|nr:hypothetical protein CNEONATNEC26_01073 [Clostridium neonatale]